MWHPSKDEQQRIEITELERSECSGLETQNWELVVEDRGLYEDTQHLVIEGKNQMTKVGAWEIQSFKGQVDEEELAKDT